MFWKVAGILVGVQVATGFLAVALSAWFAFDRSLELVENSLRLRLDGIAEEIEQRSVLADGITALPEPLRIDLSRRVPDPISLIDAEGVALLTIAPDGQAFNTDIELPESNIAVPVNLGAMLADGEIIVQMNADTPTGRWALAPLYDDTGFLAGGVLVQPLTNSIARETAETRAGFVRALWTIVGLSGAIALMLGAFFTWRLVGPLQRMTRRVERIGAGDYDARLDAHTNDEFGRLAVSINQMAEDVAGSVESLRATDTLRRELVANIGHDLRTPMTALLGYLEEAERYLENGNETAAHEALSTARRQGGYLSKLVGDLFELSVLDSATAPLRREPVPLAELLTEAANAHRAALRDADISFEIEVPPGLPIIEGDGVRLLRVLDNLLTNARHHTPEGGTVQLGAERSQDHVWIHVKDTGNGIEPDHAAHVFDRYYRGTGARTRTGTGTGLGLPISRAIARAHGGELSVASEPGKGSTFTLALPFISM